MGAKSGKSGKPGQRKKGPPSAAAGAVGRNRLALILFGGLFVGLFVVFAVAQGIGQPSVPSGDVALVQSAPEGRGNISEEQLQKMMEQTASESGMKKTPKAGSKKYDELQEQSVSELIEGVWLRGEAERMGIEITPKQTEEKLNEYKKSEWPTPAAFKEFLETSHRTQEELEERVELILITEEIQKQVANEVEPPTKDEISAYYDAAKATTFTTKPSRDVRLVVNEEKAEVEKALEELEKDNSPENWKKVAKKYSSDTTTAAAGGLQKGITREALQEPVKKLLFDSDPGELLGPVAYQGNFFIFEIVKENPAKTKSLAEVEAEISSQLTTEAQEDALSEFIAAYQSKWRSRTFCASEFAANEHCSNQKTSGHPANAPAACYEANPKTPATECPAPVEQTRPALPGSVTLLAPQGEQLVQRPRPPLTGTKAGQGSAAGAGAEEAAPESGE